MPPSRSEGDRSRLHWSAGRGVEAVRPIRDEIRTRIERLLAELIPARKG